MVERKIYTLKTILKRIRDILESRITDKYFWLKVELSNIKFHSTGHCYLELSETKDGGVVAKCSGAIWKNNLSKIKTALGKDFLNIIKKGNEILCFVKIQFTEQYGLSIIIQDVDISFNIGAMEIRRQQTIDRLSKENLLNLNKQVIVPAVIQKIAIIGSLETDGITDLIKQLDNNIHGYHFYYQVFSSHVQGVKAENELLSRLKELKGDSRFEIIAVIRGGGSKLDLDVFNSYEISKEIAFHDKPVYTGIGHENDISVADLVANKSHKTPTALGSFIVERAHMYDVKITNSYNAVIEFKEKYLEDRKSHLKLNIQTLTSESISRTRLKRGDLHSVMNRINSEARQMMNIEKNMIGVVQEVIKVNPVTYIANSRLGLKHTIEITQLNANNRINQALESYKQIMDVVYLYSKQQIEAKYKLADNIFEVISVYHPDNILVKGYAIPRLNGELIKDQKIRENREIEIELHKRVLVVSYKKEKKRWMNSIMNRLQKS